jgi:hypothetical protein
MRQVSPEQAKVAVELAFSQWGLPRKARFDNGFPFANTADRYLPTALALWLVSLGIDVVFNRPYTPQQNGSVECTQRISGRWANPRACANANALQQALDQVASDHVFVLRQRKNRDQTRLEQYPDLLNNARKYDPEKIDPDRVKQYLLQFRWSRKVYGNGRISIFGKTCTIGAKYKHQQVIISLDPQSNAWQVTLTNGKAIKKLLEMDLSKKAIADLTVFSKNFTT